MVSEQGSVSNSELEERMASSSNLAVNIHNLQFQYLKEKIMIIGYQDENYLPLTRSLGFSRERVYRTRAYNSFRETRRALKKKKQKKGC